MEDNRKNSKWKMTKKNESRTGRKLKKFKTEDDQHKFKI